MPVAKTTTRLLLLGLAAVTLFAAAVRFWHLASLPPGYWYDEAHKSLVALQIARGEQAPLYVTDNQGIEAGFFWLLAVWFRLAGASYFGARALSAALGTATIPVTFWAVHELYRSLPHARWLALAAAAWLSFLLWHVHWSRTGYETILVPLFAVALLGLVPWAWRRQTASAFVLAGLVLGLSQYTNPGARILVVQAAVTFLLSASGSWRQRLAFGLLFAGAALVVYLPLGLFFVRQPEWFFNRITFTSAGARAGGWAVYAANAAKTLWSINVRGDVMVRHNLSLRPALDPVASACMVVGLYALWAGRAHWRRHVALLAALGISLAPMVFSDGAPGFGRTLGATPFIVVLPALGLVYAANRLPRRAWGVVLAAGCLALSAGLNLRAYFGRYPEQPGLFDAFEIGQWALIDSAAQASRAGTGYIILNEAGLAHPGTEFARRLETGDLRLLNGHACLAYPVDTEQAATISVLAEWAPFIRAEFPEASSRLVLHEPEPYPYGEVFQLPANAASLSANTPALAQLGGRVDLLPANFPAVVGPDTATIAIALRWRVVAPLEVPLNVFVHLGPPQAAPLAGADGAPCDGWYGTEQWHAGEIIDHTLQLSLPPGLPPGQYPLFAGLYDWVTGERLSVAQTGGEPDRVHLGTLEISGE
jgi:4-amino-4-deoxy-L-arabinose transferase-like glycosyltransferase